LGKEELPRQDLGKLRTAANLIHHLLCNENEGSLYSMAQI